MKNLPAQIKAHAETKIVEISDENLIGIENQLKIYLINSLALKEENKMQLDICVKKLLDLCRQKSLAEVVEMIELYVDGELNVKPLSNYVDRVLITNIVKAYQDYQLKHKSKKPFNEAEYKAEQDKINALHFFEHVENGGKLPLDASWLYDYLIEVVKVIEQQEDVKKMFWAEVKADKLIPEDDKISECKRRIIEHLFLEIKSKKLHLSNLFDSQGV